MKKFNLFFALLFVSVIIRSQVISFTFTAEHTCDFVPLDSVVIENLTQSGDTILHYPDTVLTFVFTGIPDQINVINEFYVSQNYPNPFDRETNIDVYVPESDLFSFYAYDISGRQICSYYSFLEEGLHKFSFLGGSLSTYILKVGSSYANEKILMLSYGKSDNSELSIMYRGHTGNESNYEMRSLSVKSWFPYSIGDELAFTGFVNGESLTIVDAPIFDNEYLFEFNAEAPGMPSPISGPSLVCEYETGLVFEVPEQADVFFDWNLPEDWEITVGQGTNIIIADAGLESGDISVILGNSCGWGPPEILSVSVIAPPVANAGNDMIDMPGTSVQLGANTPEYGEGEWTGTGGNFSDINDPEAEFFGEAGESYVLTWTITNFCGTDSDDITVSFLDSGEFSCGGFLNYQGYDYQTVLIGEQCWFAENLRYDNGCSQAVWQEYTDVGWCGPFNNQQVYNDDYGLLYQWSAVMDGSTQEGAQGLCPTGWRVPTHDDWTILEREVCNSPTCETDFPFDMLTTGFRGTNEGSQLAGTDLWDPGALISDPAFNPDSDFSASPGGVKLPFEFLGSPFGFEGIDGRWWTSSIDGNEAWYRGIDIQNTGVHRNKTEHEWAFSVRCVKEVEPPFNCGDEVSFIYNGVEVTYGSVEGQNNTCWMDRNLGAAQVATAHNDQDAFGDLFQWGRLVDGHQERTSGTTTEMSNTDVPGHPDYITTSASPYDWRNPPNNNLWQGDGSINDPCPPGWRVPTSAELNNERTSWSPNNYTGAFLSDLKWTAAGSRHNNGNVQSEGEVGAYHSYTINNEDVYALFFYDTYSMMWANSIRGAGRSVRCIKDM